MVLSASTDTTVNLFSIISISSASTFSKDDEEEEEEAQADGGQEEQYSQPVDGLVAEYRGHDESVYAVEWSMTDPWIFASLGYDRVVIGAVPILQKYKIIL